MKPQEIKALWGFAEHSSCETLFLDRDGVIIERDASDRPIADTNQLVIKKNFLDNASRIAMHFKFIIAFSSIPAGMKNDTDHDKQEGINEAIKREVAKVGGRIDGFYTEWDTDPATGISLLLLLNARRDFPAIYFTRSLLLGATQADQQLAFNCGMSYFGVNEKFDLKAIYDSDALIESELNILRKEIRGFSEVLVKFMNSPVWINGIRLAARCCCHAMASNKKVMVVFDRSSGFNSKNFLYDLNLISKGERVLSHVVPVEATTVEETCREMEAMCKTGDIGIGLSSISSSESMIESMLKVQGMGVITISVTGAKPSPLDRCDVVIKVPTTDIGQIQSLFKLVVSMIHKLVTHEMKEKLMF